jgi:hypothetical protein
VALPVESAQCREREREREKDHQACVMTFPFCPVATVPFPFDLSPVKDGVPALGPRSSGWYMSLTAYPNMCPNTSCQERTGRVGLAEGPRAGR